MRAHRRRFDWRGGLGASSTRLPPSRSERRLGSPPYGAPALCPYILIHFSNSLRSQRSAARILYRGPGQARLLSPRKHRGGWSTARRTIVSALWARRASGETHAPRGAPPAAFLSPAPCFRGAHTCGLWTRKSGAASAARRRPSVQPSKAAGPSAGGRLAEASRPCGYEPQRRAPHPAPPSGSSLEDAPRSSRT